MSTRARAAAVDIDEIAPVVPWDDFVPMMQYRHNEHVTIIGPTQRGKTTLGIELLEQRRNVVLIGTKPKDPTLQRVVRDKRYRRMLTVPSVQVARRIVVWPKMRGITDTREQKTIIARVLDDCFEDGNRTVFADEVHYLAEFLHLAPRLKLWWTQGASNGLSLMAGFQRPAWVPRDAYSAATHLFLFGTNDAEDIKSISGLGGANNRAVREVVWWLGADASRHHDFVYLNTRTGQMVRSRFRKSEHVERRTA